MDEYLKILNQRLNDQVKKRTLELEEVSQELEAANKELSNLDRLKNEFLNIIGHEVRTSLNGIRGSVQILKVKIDDDKLSNLMRILDLSISRLERFSNTALTITEIQSGSRKVLKQNINLLSMIQDVKVKLNDKITTNNIKLNVGNIPNEMIILGDLSLLSICFESIIENAAKFSPYGGEITISAKKMEDEIHCEIADQGKGFSETALKYLFKPFIPGEPHIDENIGLNLPLANIIMEAHSGRIEVENIRDTGALVRLIFKIL